MEGDPLEDPTDIFALPTAQITIAASGPVRKTNVSVQATASANALIELSDELDASIAFGAVFATANASIDILGNASLEASVALSVAANSDVATSLERAPDDDGDQNDDDSSQDASIAASIIQSNASVSVGGTATLTAGTTATITAHNQVDVTTHVDGTGGDSDQGGTLASSIVSGDTRVTVQDSATIQAGGDLTLDATSDRSVTTTAVATAGGATEDGDDQTMTEGQQTLDENNAETSDGDVTLAAAIALSTLNGETQTQVMGGTVESSSGDVHLLSNATHAVNTVADATTTSGSEGTGVGVGVALSFISTENLASVGGNASLDGVNVNVNATTPASLNHAEAKSGASGDEGDTGVAGALAINSTIVDTLAQVGNADFGGAALTAVATATTDSVSLAKPLEDGGTGESLGVGASVAVSVADHTTHAAILDNASVTDVGDVNILATSDHDVTTESESAAAGGTGIAAVVSLVIANEDTHAEVGSGSELAAAGNVSVAADHRGQITTKAEGDAEGADDAALGIALSLNFVNQRTSAKLDRNVSATGGVSCSFTQSRRRL